MRRFHVISICIYVISWLLLISFVSCLNPDNILADEAQHMTGIIYTMPFGVGGDSAEVLSSNSFINWYRYPAETRTWSIMSDATAYSRDVGVGGDTYIYGAQDGETWTASAVSPDDITLDWPTITFYEYYSGNEDCFVSPGWTTDICYTTSLYVLWYTSSQCRTPGQWTMSFFNNGSQFHEGTFKVLPQIPPGTIPVLYNQLSYSDHYANRCWKAEWDTNKPRPTTECDENNTEKATIAQLGCFLTGSCMILGYHGVTVNPPTLNTWLNDPKNNGYQLGGVDGHAVAKYARDVGKKEVYYKGWDSLSNLVNKVCSRGPQLAHVRKPGRPKFHHFVTVIGQNEELTTYKIVDPAGGVERLLTDKYQDIGSIRVYEGPEYEFKDELNAISFKFHSPGELLLTNPQGQQLGIDPLTGQSYNEIPNGFYGEELIEDPLDENSVLESKSIEIMRPGSGKYELKITGTGDGTYDLSVRNYDVQGGSSTETLADIPITTNDVHLYAFDVDKTPGFEIELDGGFDGVGQRPRDVNKFLTYSTISSNRVDTPAGATSYALLVVYGTTILADTFEASLDSTDVSGLFSPTAGSSQTVNIPLHEGRNVLMLSVQGSVPNRIARDTDRIVFLVPALNGN